MAIAYKVLGQVNPAATTATTLYTVPSAKMTVLSNITVCNTSAATKTFRIAIRPDGAALSTTHYIAYDTSIPANSTITYANGYTMDAADVVTVYASDTSLVFSAYGSEQ